MTRYGLAETSDAFFAKKSAGGKSGAVIDARVAGETIVSQSITKGAAVGVGVAVGVADSTGVAAIAVGVSEGAGVPGVHPATALRTRRLTLARIAARAN
jgi:hypothetical protein